MARLLKMEVSWMMVQQFTSAQRLKTSFKLKRPMGSIIRLPRVKKVILVTSSV